MPRPVVIKVASHDSQPRTKSTGSINVEILRAIETKPNTDTHISNSLENLLTGSSLVRSLINKYESGNSPDDAAALVKQRSKSLVDLSHEPKPRFETHNTQDDFLFLRNNHIDNGELLQDWKQNFKQAMSKFQQGSENTTALRERVNIVGDVHERAKQLLEATKHDYFWFNDVMSLLQDIVNTKDAKQPFIKDIDIVQTCTNDLLDQNKNDDTDSLSPHSEEHLREPNWLEHLNIDEPKQIYENKLLQQTHLNVETPANDLIHFEKKTQEPKTEKKLSLKYFGIDNKDSEEWSPSETKNHSDDFRIDQLARMCNENGLLDSETLYEDEVFEDQEDNFETINLNNDVQESRDGFSTENHKKALLTVENMMQKIEECDKKIDTITIENHAEANRLNEMLIQVLIKLDDLRTYDDGVIVTMRHKAFSFTQECIKKLKDKVFGDEY